MIQHKGNFHFTVSQHISSGCRPLRFQSKFITVHIKIKAVQSLYAGNIFVGKCHHCRSESGGTNIPAILILMIYFTGRCITFSFFTGNRYIRYTELKFSSIRIFAVLYINIIFAADPVILIHQKNFIFRKIIILSAFSYIDSGLCKIYRFLLTRHIHICPGLKPVLVTFCFFQPLTRFPKLFSTDLKCIVVLRNFLPEDHLI